MKTDLSWVLYCKYFSGNSPIVRIELQNKTMLEGRFTGFTRGGRSYIRCWFFSPADALFGRDVFGFSTEMTILQKNLYSVTFLEDQSTIYFS